MKPIRIIMAIMTLVVMVSCMSPERLFLRSYVTEYFSINEIELYKRKTRGTVGIRSIPYVHNDYYNSFICSFKSTGKEKYIYDSLCMKHNDMSYNKNIKVYIHDNFSNSACGMDFLSIGIVSDSDFDTDHPAGTDLGDIVKFASYTLKEYIDSGYKSLCDWSTVEGLAANFNGIASVYHPLEKLVCELTSNDLCLFDKDFSAILDFESEPTLSQTHRLTVTMTADDGREFSASYDLDFQEGSVGTE